MTVKSPPLEEVPLVGGGGKRRPKWESGPKTEGNKSPLHADQKKDCYLNCPPKILNLKSGILHLKLFKMYDV
ncbi:MAG: hypothetical protein DA408_20650 [Bacteroidetes bacterium]|nr:MAG: hypothetical protein C7N36_14500 [Bacteroidota bacterium]PTM08358.1 MAG: hypothetical protein DA408_20650 [Bacteroidota bacterium]